MRRDVNEIEFVLLKASGAVGFEEFFVGDGLPRRPKAESDPLLPRVSHDI